jgi:hypothetical protein
MNSTGKLILGMVGGVFLVCAFLGLAGNVVIHATGRTFTKALQSNPDQAAAISESIADYDLPPDFGEAYAKQALGFSLVSYTGQDRHSHVIFFQLPDGLQIDLSQINSQIELVDSGQQKIKQYSQVVGEIPAVIRGQETTLLLTEGVNSAGQTYRQASSIFNGKGGQALVVFERPVSSWDQGELEGFIASIH